MLFMRRPVRNSLVLLLALPVARALERAPGLGEEHVVERGGMQAQVGDRDPLGVERAHDLGEVAHTLRQLRGDRVGRGGRLLSEAGQHQGEALAIARVCGHRFNARAPDRRLQLRRRALGHDPAVVDDADAVGQHVGLLQILRRQEHRHPVGRQPAHLIPQRGAALHVQSGRRLIQEQQARAVHEREAKVEPALHAARIAPDLAVGGVGQPDPLEQLVARFSRSVLPSPCRALCRRMCSRPVRNGSSADSCSEAPIARRTAAPW